MKTKKTAGELEQQLHDAGFKGAVVSTDHLPELRSAYGHLLEEGSLDRDFYDEIVERYGLAWDFELSGKFPKARSVIITAAQQPKISLEFQLDGMKYYGIVPPTYVYDTDYAIQRVLSQHLHKRGYEVCETLLPTKLLAVRSGLAEYGRNNIAYIDGWGSYFRLRAYLSDVPCKDDQWREPLAMKLCKKCTACVKKCPTSAIGKDKFLMDAGKCLTFLNEGNEEFPEWVDLRWHNCLIGCMVCQDVCPANKGHINWLMPGEEFGEEETRMILDGISHENLPEKTREKLRKVGMLDNSKLLERNLKALIASAKGRGDS